MQDAPVRPRDSGDVNVARDGVDRSRALVAFQIGPSGMPLEPAETGRPWMTATDQRFANRCLPLLIANQSGWVLRNTVAFTAIWSGLDGADATLVEYDPSPERPRAGTFFGYGILTWSIPYVFRTPPGVNLLVRGPANMPKDAVSPLEGVVESDWAASTFTMNWKITRPFTPVRFEVGEPVCMIVPQRRGELEEYSPWVRPIESDPDLAERHQAWALSRQEFLQERSDGWQRDYFQGHHVDGTHGVPAHQTRLHLASFRADDEFRTGSDHRTSATGTASAAPATHEGGST